MESSKKNQWSIPRTISILSNIRSIKHIDVASSLINRFRRTGNVFINLTGDAGLSLYSSIPKRFKGKFIDVFKRNPKAVLGLTKTHTVIHSAKIFDKYRLSSLLNPVSALSLILSQIPQYIIWVIFTVSLGHLVFSVSSNLKRIFKS